jgi:NAD(P)-dependent dehydrogenase (short-subunit alcohol dehydrogenase family)
MRQHPALSEGRVAVITGGASGIGLAAAKRFATLGMKLCLADLRQEALDAAAAQLDGASVVTVATMSARWRKCSVWRVAPMPNSARPAS